MTLGGCRRNTGKTVNFSGNVTDPHLDAMRAIAAGTRIDKDRLAPITHPKTRRSECEKAREHMTARRERCDQGARFGRALSAKVDGLRFQDDDLFVAFT
jgi:hypothetical protein